jgi:hypothetical protein
VIKLNSSTILSILGTQSRTHNEAMHDVYRMRPQDTRSLYSTLLVLYLDTLHEPKQALHIHIPPAIPVQILVSDRSELC